MKLLADITKRFLAMAMMLFLVGCSEESLYSNLSEQEANEMVAALSLAGLDASKQKLKGDDFSVSTSSDDFAQAVHLLKNKGLPRQHFDTLGGIFAKEGFVSSPLEERARLNHALSQEIAATLSSIDGVVLARVHLAVPAKNDLNDTAATSSASVFVKHRQDVDLTGRVSLIKAMVVNGIENLAYENVTVALFESLGDGWQPAADVTPLPFQAASANQMSLLPMHLTDLNAVVVALMVTSLVILLALLYVRRSRRV